MSRFWVQVRRFYQGEQAAEVTELAIILGLIVVLSVGLIISLGTKVSNMFNVTESALP